MFQYLRLIFPLLSLLKVQGSFILSFQPLNWTGPCDRTIYLNCLAQGIHYNSPLIPNFFTSSFLITTEVLKKKKKVRLEKSPPVDPCIVKMESPEDHLSRVSSLLINNLWFIQNNGAVTTQKLLFLTSLTYLKTNMNHRGVEHTVQQFSLNILSLFFPPTGMKWNNHRDVRAYLPVNLFTMLPWKCPEINHFSPTAPVQFPSSPSEREELMEKGSKR